MGWIHGVMTLILMLVFIGIVIWAWRAERVTAFEEAARLPLRDDAGDTERGGGVER
jgi:cytochrome c oxidase cbb3-type subunit IV